MGNGLLVRCEPWRRVVSSTSNLLILNATRGLPAKPPEMKFGPGGMEAFGEDSSAAQGDSVAFGLDLVVVHVAVGGEEFEVVGHSGSPNVRVTGMISRSVRFRSLSVISWSTQQS